MIKKRSGTAMIIMNDLFVRDSSLTRIEKGFTTMMNASILRCNLRSRSALYISLPVTFEIHVPRRVLVILPEARQNLCHE
jgi:hypothetical protein